MKWAFWRSDAASAPAVGSRTASARAIRAITEESDPSRADPAIALKIRARRRLIGAAALLLAAVIVVPMILDPAPRPVPDTVPIEIPSEKTPFTPRLPLPPVPDPSQVQGAPPPDVAVELPKAVGDEAKGAQDDKAAADAKPASKAAGKTPGTSPEPPTAKSSAAAADKTVEAQRARDILEGRISPQQAATEGKYLVQAAALRSEQSARNMVAKLKQAGLPSFTERVQASDGTRWRVRAGPYATRQDAERARAKLRELGVDADLIAP